MQIKIDPFYYPFKQHIFYSFQVILEDILRLKSDIPIVFYYGKNTTSYIKHNHKVIKIQPSEFFTKSKYLKINSYSKTVVRWIDSKQLLIIRKKFFEQKIPVSQISKKKSDHIVELGDNCITINFDLIASAFYFLTRYEEIYYKNNDSYDRFPVKASIAYKEDFLYRPVVNEYAELVWDWIKFLAPQLKRPKTKFQIRITHDVDHIVKFNNLFNDVRIVASLIFKHHHITEASKYFLQRIKSGTGLSNDPYDTFEYLMDFSEQLDSISHFYFMASEQSHYDTRYCISDAKVQRAIDKILKRGHKIGLHPGLGTYKSYEKLVIQKSRFDKATGVKEYGARQHYLQWNAPLTWKLYESAGIKYDSTVGFAEKPGFRCSICTPFRVFDAVEGKRINLLEIPLIVMDKTIYSPKYEGISYQYAHQRLEKIITNIKKYGGVYTLLWHTAALDQLGLNSLKFLLSPHNTS